MLAMHEVHGHTALYVGAEMSILLNVVLLKICVLDSTGIQACLICCRARVTCLVFDNDELCSAYSDADANLALHRI
jgi:hypothetical protein